MILVKIPWPVPFEVWLLAIVGLAVVFQQIPLAVTAEPPSEVTFPPPVPVVVDVADGIEVVTVGIKAPVLN